MNLYVLAVSCALAALSWAFAFMGGGSFFAYAGAGFGIVAVIGYLTRLRQRPEGTSAAEAAVDADPPAGETPTPEVRPCPALPDTLDARSILRAFCESVKSIASPVGAHLWIWDDAAGQPRLVSSAGSVALSSTSGDIDSADVAQAIDEGNAVLRMRSRTSTPTNSSTHWRYVVPLGSGSIRGAVSLDLSADEAPDSDKLNRMAAWFRMPLMAALAMYVAASRDEAAKTLFDMTREISKTLEPDAVLEAALDRAMSLVSAATGSVLLLDEATGRLRIATARGLPRRVIESTDVAVGEGIAGWVAATGQPLLVEDMESPERRGQRHGIRSALSVPMVDDEGLIGVLNVGSRVQPARFTEAHRETLAMLARQATVTWRTACAVSSATSIYFDSLKALALALETKDPYSTGGTERVMELASSLGKACGLSADEQQALEIASMLHDIGMSAALHNAGHERRTLSTVERGLLKMHPVIAADILKNAPALKDAVPIVYHHHEHYDGSGYVSGASGDEIPVAARILSVADAFVAMTSKRPYRPALTVGQALQEMERYAGTQFDPHVVEELVKLMQPGTDRVRGERSQ